MKSVAVGEFKAKCLGLLEEVRLRKRGLVITRRGVPIAEVRPFKKDAEKERDKLLGSILFENDIVSPLNEDWDVLK